jgi:TusA-related sulfurtransferase/DNA-directed RNA polymerase subunit RPC12/RpoP
MKFVCMKCETFMLFQKVEKPGEESLGVMFECPQCGSRFSMVTNPGETALVSALGVKIGGRTTAPEPFELTRNTLKESVVNQTAPSATSASTASGGSCPFSSMLSSMQSGEALKVKWTEEALERMERIPEFVRPMVKGGIEAYAAKKGYQMITPAVVEESKAGIGSDEGGLPWTPGAQKRLENIPSFIREIARKEIERIAKEKGLVAVTDAMMDEAKDQFGQFMGGSYMGY